LLKKIRRLSAKRVLNARVRISDPNKYWLLIASLLKYKTGFLN
jgi:hypothetical protein